ncbi:exocyst complex component EXO84B isoform X1 [Hevea brasiliensis]|uniref:exocyst complex component EXO84B isoform X1 n=2 Tax=Hevea brasiliensis TaxID=3981 RepID=UPI0025F3E9CC|nr:exocyst complex component EXO84B isoform X1 [Hevea brasiliensis]
MESFTASSRFQFRDHQQPEDATDSDASSDISSLSSDRDEESELESMTGKGIRRLCTELLEIKATSDEDFHRNIFANYSTFVGVYEEVKEMEKELMQLRTHVSMQKRLVKYLTDSVYLRVLSEETVESITEELKCDEYAPLNQLEAHISNISETLDMLLSENRADDAIAILEMEEENLQEVQLEDDIPSDVLMLYNSAISERKAMLTLQLTLVAENSRITAAELQKALVGICRLGEGHLSTQLLLKYYHSRLATGINNLQSSKSFLQGLYIKELSKFVFSMISQAARSFVMLYGETSPYALELILWAEREIEVFVVSFAKHLKSTSEISSGLSAAVEAVQFAISYCSLLEAQRLVLQPCLVKHLRTCMEDVLETHIDHFKKVISIFTATDAWVLGRYLVSGILNEDCSYMVVGQQPEYCMLTNSGRKFVTLLQAIIKDVTPLAALQMESSILSGLSNLFIEYIAILEKAISSKINVPEKGGSRIILAESVPQQVSILSNLSTLERFFSSTLTSIFSGINCSDSELTKNGSQQQELDSCLMVIQQASAQLRAQFFQQFIYRVVSLEVCKWTPEICVDSETCSSLGNGPMAMPSAVFQVLFLELRKLDKLTEFNVFEVDWLMELLRELIESIFVWISNNKDIWKTNEENQFVLDMHFLVEITRYGEYFSKNPVVPANLMKSSFISAGLDPIRDDDDEWATKAAAEAIQRLLEIEEVKSHSNGEIGSDLVVPPENHSDHASETLQDDARSSLEVFSLSEEDLVATEESEVAVNNRKVTLNTELNGPDFLSDAMKDEFYSVDKSTTHPPDISGDLDNIEPENAAYDRFHFAQETSLPNLLLSVGIGKASEKSFPTDRIASPRSSS